MTNAMMDGTRRNGSGERRPPGMPSRRTTTGLWRGTALPDAVTERLSRPLDPSLVSQRKGTRQPHLPPTSKGT